MLQTSVVTELGTSSRGLSEIEERGKERRLETCIFGLYGRCTNTEVVESTRFGEDLDKIYETLKFGDKEFLWSYPSLLLSREFKEDYNQLLQERVEILRKNLGYGLLTAVERVLAVKVRDFKCGICKKFEEKKSGDQHE